MTFRDREKQRLVCLKPRLFSAAACKPGIYRKRERDFCLRNDRAKENLHASIRDDALRYFGERRIGWHYGIDNGPSNHLCCSQSCCVNFWFPFVDAPEHLALVLRGLGYEVAEMLPFELDRSGDSCPYVAFEWIGKRNYLGEHVRGKVARDNERTRGANFTSLDFAFRFRRTDGGIQIVAGEWKYTEYYVVGRNKQISRNGTNRLEEIYRPALEDRVCQIRRGRLAPEVLFFDPFDQLMRQQLLCSFMEGRREMKADIVSLLHVAPTANRELMARVTSPVLKACSADIHEIWGKLVKSGRFSGKSVEDLLPLVCRYAPDAEWADYMQLRYGDMR